MPYGITTPDQPNIASTRWRTVADHKRRLYFFESALAPNVFWVDMKRLDFSQGASTRTLDLGTDMNRILAGEVSAQFVVAKPFSFMAAE